ncbi:PAS domain-containing sensor histidine kinase [Dactylosporangium sp. AC04546]|uniref:PAS domain-containing sensor histidine kinase n=1 Tax=Dactylosporangium sp. AC04546 TaxID=2862460 RepID=UPI001EDCAD1A|nr:PAS domain-containing sensor histidine kinase [Dactylosporangium sp. AC04546]WVK82609.1 PAS domain-containing sensor histidine kinase [Dactylosporangium sp. AC04546]
MLISGEPVDIPIDDRGVVSAWPPEATKLFGYERELALGAPFAELLLPARLRDAAVPAGQPFDAPLVHRDGHELRVALALRPGCATVRALGERTPPDLELYLRARAETGLEERHRLLTELSGLRTEFIRVASHELRTPLTSIVTFATMLEAGDDVVGLSPADRQAALSVIRRNAERMQLVVADLLLLTQLETAEEPLDTVPVDLAGLLSGLAAGATVGPGPAPRGDPALLRQLLHTAVGVVTVAHDAGAPIGVDARHEDDRWTVVVTAGTAATLTAERLLSLRVPHPDHPDEHRTGALALMLAREIAARHGGAMVTSVDRPGVTVRITLPDVPDG